MKNTGYIILTVIAAVLAFTTILYYIIPIPKLNKKVSIDTKRVYLISKITNAENILEKKSDNIYRLDRKKCNRQYQNFYRKLLLKGYDFPIEFNQLTVKIMLMDLSNDNSNKNDQNLRLLIKNSDLKIPIYLHNAYIGIDITDLDLKNEINKKAIDNFISVDKCSLFEISKNTSCAQMKCSHRDSLSTFISINCYHKMLKYLQKIIKPETHYSLLESRDLGIGEASFFLYKNN